MKELTTNLGVQPLHEVAFSPSPKKVMMRFGKGFANEEAFKEIGGQNEKTVEVASVYLRFQVRVSKNSINRGKCIIVCIKMVIRCEQNTTAWSQFHFCLLYLKSIQTYRWNKFYRIFFIVRCGCFVFWHGSSVAQSVLFQLESTLVIVPDLLFMIYRNCYMYMYNKRFIFRSRALWLYHWRDMC